MIDPITAVDEAMAALKQRIADAVAAAGMPMGEAPRLGEFVAQRRKALGLSLDEVAKLAGCTKSHVWEIEQERSRNPTVAMVNGLARALSTPFTMMASAALASVLAADQR